jgi:large subunit ribosomal protein L25
MKKHILQATKRDVAGRKVKALRKQGQLPATVYGKKVKSISVSVSKDAFMNVYKEAGETGLIELSVGGDMRPVLVHTVQIDPVSSIPLHVEFHQVDLNEKVHAKVPVELVGESAAVAQKLGVLLTVLDEIEVEALPAELPERISVDVTVLADVDQELKVEQLSVPKGVTVLTEAELTVVKVGPLVTKEAEEQAAAEQAAAAEAAAATGAEAPAAGEQAAQPQAEAAKGEPSKAPTEKKE